ncbi:SRPBCC family protein [Chitinophaga vietnamensis]|uniref:SRPBCC family protein n=1 Tax=Chitinophaga vietnamensis TaxID=2593957 RepID=UPI001178448D|nr:SRPBCC family protein [Chitinophaga vietnamensis]
MITATISTTTTAATSAQLWKLMSNVNAWSQWDEGVETAELHGNFAAGNYFTLKPKGGPKVKILIEETRTNAYFRDKTSFPLAKMYGEHWYEDTPDGTRLTVTMTMKGLLAPLWNKIVMKNIIAGMEADLQAQINNAKKLQA